MGYRLPYRSRGVLQNARRVRRKAKINEAIINRAFCKTPLLAAIGVPLGFKRSKMFFMVFIFIQRIGPTHVLYAKIFP